MNVTDCTTGRVLSATATVVHARLPAARVGDGARLIVAGGERIAATVAAVFPEHVALAPHAPTIGLRAGDAVERRPDALDVPLGPGLLGRALDANADPIDGLGPLPAAREQRVPSNYERRALREPLWTGVSAIDGLLTIARGARVGIFGAPGAGKTALLAAIAGGVRADAVIVALVGERAREAKRWVDALDSRTTAVVATTDRAAAERIRAARVAMFAAADLRRRGLHVLVLFDSLARYVGALREIALALGEPCGRGGYPPRVFTEMSGLLEAGGATAGGSVTVVATVLSDGGDEREPLSEAARATLDGHIVLSGALAQAGKYPAIDVLASLSRTMPDVVSPAQHAATLRFRSAMGALEQTREARALGLGYENAPFLHRSLLMEREMERFLRTESRRTEPAETVKELVRIADSLGEPETF